MNQEKCHRLINAALKGKNLNDIVNLASQLLENPLVVISTSYHILSYSTVLKSTDFTWLEATRRGYITLEFAATLNHWDDLMSAKNNGFFLDVNEISNKRRRFFRLEYKQHHLGYLNVTEEKTKLEDIEMTAYQLVADILAKEISIAQKRLSWESHVQEEELLMELLDHQFIDRMHFLERIKGSPLETVKSFQVGCIDFSKQISYHAGKDEIQEMMRKHMPQILFAISGKRLIILVKEALKTIAHELSSFLEERGLVLGLSDSFTDLYKFDTYYQQAVAAINYQKLLENPFSVVNYNAVRHYHMYASFDHRELFTFCDPAVIYLKSHDEKYQTEYVQTLCTYLLHHKSIQETADKLYVHRNTINYRIQKIKDLTEIDFEDSRHNFLLINSCEILHYLENE